MNDIKDTKGTMEIEPKVVLEGNELVLRAEGWPAFCPVIIKIDDQVTRPARIALGIRNNNGILPDARGNFVCMLSTFDLNQGNHTITIVTKRREHIDVFKGQFEILTREQSFPSKGSDTEFPDGDEQKEEPESWYFREIDFYNRRFKKIGFVPENIRQYQLEQIKKLRGLKKRKFYGSTEETTFGYPPGPPSPELAACNWVPVGAGPVVIHSVSPDLPTAYSGRTLSIAIDNSSSNTIFIGTANGGIWKSTDAGLTWSAKSDYNDSLAIGTIVIDPNDSSRIFAGTGEFHHTGSGGLLYYGSGILKSTDGGETWTNQMSSPSFQGDEISKLLFDPADSTSQHMFLSSATGVYESVDGGLNWTQLRAGSVSDLVIIKISAGPPPTIKLIAAFYGSGLWISTQTGVTWSPWTKITGVGIPSSPPNRIALAQSKNNPQTVYALFTSSVIEGIARTTDGGSTWNAVTVKFNDKIKKSSSKVSGHYHDVTIPAADIIGAPSSHNYTTTNNGSPDHSHTISLSASEIQDLSVGKSVTKTTDSDMTGHSHSFPLKKIGQLWYNLHISAHPNDIDTIYLGELWLWKNNTAGGIFNRLPVQHPDQHCFTFDPVDPDNVIWAGNDGGIYHSGDGGVTWSHRNRNLNTLQYITISLHPKWETIMIGGTQDNGTHRYRGNPAWQHVAGGDGGFTAIDPSLPTRMYHGYTNNKFYRSDDAGKSWKVKTGSIEGSAEFYPPFILDPSNANVCYFGNEKLWRSDNNADDWSAVTGVLTGNITAIAVHPSDSNIIYVSTSSAHIYKIERTGATWDIADIDITEITGLPVPSGVYTSDLAVDKSGTVWLTVSSVLASESTGEFTNDHVYRLFAGSSTWETRSNGLAQGNPVNSIVIDPTNSNRLFCGADIGVFRTEDGGASWELWDDGIPNVPIFDLAIHGPRRLLRAATHGRGVWERPIDSMSCPKVDLYIRDNILDSGRIQPSPESPQHPFKPSVGVYHWQSTDIKVDSPDPDFQTINPISDYVIFEGMLVHRNPVAGGTNRFYVQVHNRGTSKATDVRVRAFFGTAAPGLPPLPQDFWHLGKPFNGDPSISDWLPIGATINLGELEPAKPMIAEWDWRVPTGDITHSCLLVLVTCNEDPLVGSGILDVDSLVKESKHVALKNLFGLETVAGGGGLAPEDAIIMEFHRSKQMGSLYDLEINWGTLPSDSIILIAFEKLTNRSAVLTKPEELKKLGISIVNDKKNYFKEKIDYRCGELKYLDLSHTYQITHPKDGFTKIPTIYIPKDKPIILAINVILGKEIGIEPQFDILQTVNGKLIGGNSYFFNLKPKIDLNSSMF